MPDKDESFRIERDNFGKDDNFGRGYEPDIQKSSLPDFQYTPATPPTPPPSREGNSNSSSSEE